MTMDALVSSPDCTPPPPPPPCSVSEKAAGGGAWKGPYEEAALPAPAARAGARKGAAESEATSAPNRALLFDTVVPAETASATRAPDAAAEPERPRKPPELAELEATLQALRLS